MILDVETRVSKATESFLKISFKTQMKTFLVLPVVDKFTKTFEF